jgi:hypothetical protein
MKRVVIFFFLALGLISCQVIQAQTTLKQDSTSTIHRNVISTNVPLIIAGTVNLNYERAITKKLGLNFMIAYELTNRSPAQYEHTTLLFTQVQSRFYPFGKSPQGFFVGGYLFYGYESFLTHPIFDDGGGEYFPAQQGNVSSISFGPVAGYKFLIIKRIAVELAFQYGPNFSWDNNPFDYDVNPLANKSISLPAINLGYVFR